MTKYTIAPSTAITSKGQIFSEGRKVTKDDFPTEEIFNSLVTAKKIISSESKAEEKKSDSKKADEKKSEEKKAEEKK